MALTRAKLERLPCAHCGSAYHNEPMTFHPRCHPDAGLSMVYDTETKILDISCAECRRQVVDLQIVRSARVCGNVFRPHCGPESHLLAAYLGEGRLAIECSKCHDTVEVPLA